MKIGVIQLTSVESPYENLEKIQHFIDESRSQNIEAIFLPECFYSMSDGSNCTPYLVKSDEGNEHFENIRNLAEKNEIFILGGTAATLINGDIVNRAYHFDPLGADLGHYDKRHLFSCAIEEPGGRVKKLNEGNVYTCGKKGKIINAGPLKIGAGICFDLRFSEDSVQYRKQGANLLTFSSAFTVPSGRDHWHTLVRARAIENQCFVVAAAQWGKHNKKMISYGHSLIVDPWGKILVDAGEGEKLISFEINLQNIPKVRSAIIMGQFFK